MGTLFTSLLNSTGALRVYGQVFNVIENNITNANTPGYVKQEQTLVAMPFDPSAGLSGGIIPGAMLSARSKYLEQAVRDQKELLGNAEQRAADLAQVESLFNISGTAGVPKALNDFFNSFSQLSVNPNDEVARQSVIDAAGAVAETFNQNQAGISTMKSNVDSQTREVVSAINDLAATISGINAKIRSNAQSAEDAGLDAEMNASLEQLSELVHFSAIKTSDGSITVYVGGQTPLVIGDHTFPISADFSTPQTILRDAQGNDFTSQIQNGGGKLGALLEEKNVMLPGYSSALDAIAQTLADSVNSTLAAGVDRNGNPPVTNLFTYNLAIGAAGSLKVTNITPDEIAAALPSAPGGNGNAIALSHLGTQPLVNGFSFTQAYGNLGGLVGRDSAKASQEKSAQQDAVTQAQQQRQSASGVSLDEEAARLLQFQQSYQAIGKLVNVLNSLTETVMNMVH